MAHFLSIITINYNNRIGLKDTIESVIYQDYAALEYIVIDGGSTDGSADVIKQYSSNINYWVSEQDAGIYAAMNKGIKVSTGAYLLFLNSGDVLNNKNIIQTIADSVKEHKFDIVYGDLIVIDQFGKEKLKKYSDKLSFEYFSYETLPHPSTLINKKIFDKYGLYDTNLKIVSDWKFFLIAICKYNCSYTHLNIAIAKFRTDGLSSSEKSAQIITNEKQLVYDTEFPHFIEGILELMELRSKFNNYRNSRKMQILEKLGLIKLYK